jgi:hypothetical protein
VIEDLQHAILAAPERRVAPVSRFGVQLAALDLDQTALRLGVGRRPRLLRLDRDLAARQRGPRGEQHDEAQSPVLHSPSGALHAQCSASSAP